MKNLDYDIILSDGEILEIENLNIQELIDDLSDVSEALNLLQIDDSDIFFE